MRSEKSTFCTIGNFEKFQQKWRDRSLDGADPIVRKAKAIADAQAWSWNLPSGAAADLLQTVLLVLSGLKQAPDFPAAYIRQTILSEIHSTWRKNGRSTVRSINEPANRNLLDETSELAIDLVEREMRSDRFMTEFVNTRPEVQRKISKFLIDCDAERRVSKARVIRHFAGTYKKSEIESAYDRLVSSLRERCPELSMIEDQLTQPLTPEAEPAPMPEA